MAATLSLFSFGYHSGPSSCRREPRRPPLDAACAVMPPVVSPTTGPDSSAHRAHSRRPSSATAIADDENCCIRLHEPRQRGNRKPCAAAEAGRSGGLGCLVHPDGNNQLITDMDIKRRNMLVLFAMSFAVGASYNGLIKDEAIASEYADMPALRGKDYGKTKMRYPDYTETQSGLQYKDLRVGDGPQPKVGDTVVIDWDGYTIGYYGRIFEARNKTKGGSFEGGDKDFYKFKIGSGQVIPAFEEAITGMSPGGVRRIIVPPDLGYPNNDFNTLGPRPTTFSGQRALDFVLRNQGLIDKTLLFDIELLRVVPG